MHSATVFFALAALASASAVGVVNDVYAYPSYKYSYGVADKLTGDQKSASEVRDGAVTKGSYSLVQPDGVLRTVNYIVTPHGGFQAQVINKGAAIHPAVYGKGAIGGIGLGGVGLGGLGARSVVGGLGLGIGGLQGGLIGGGLQGGLIGGRGLGLGLGGLGGLQGGLIGGGLQGGLIGGRGLGLGLGGLGGLQGGLIGGGLQGGLIGGRGLGLGLGGLGGLQGGIIG